MAATSDGGAWAAGFTGSGTSSRTLILRLDGTTWTRVPTPSPGNGDELLGVTTAPDGTVWAAGWADSSPGAPYPLLLRWNGTAWTQVPAPVQGFGELFGVTAVSADNAWAFGYTITGSATVLSHGVTLILHWNGATWTRVPSPNVGLDSDVTGVAAVSADSAWAIGYTDISHSENALLLRWNGTSWTLLPNPAPAGTYPLSVSASAGTAWAVGTTTPPGCHAVTCSKNALLRWNGTAWTLVPTPGPPGTFLGGIAALSGNEALAVGGRDGKTLILRWNGTSWN